MIIGQSNVFGNRRRIRSNIGIKKRKYPACLRGNKTSERIGCRIVILDEKTIGGIQKQVQADKHGQKQNRFFIFPDELHENYIPLAGIPTTRLLFSNDLVTTEPAPTTQ